MLVIDFTYAYFLCVCAAYKGRLDGGKDEGLGFDIPVPEVPSVPMPGADEKMEDAPMEEEKMDEPMEDMGEEAKEE